MDIVCTCSACGAKFKVGAQAAGKKARCPKCSAVNTIPAATPATTSLPPSPVAAPVPVMPPPQLPVAGAPVPVSVRPAAPPPRSAALPVQTAPVPANTPAPIFADTPSDSARPRLERKKKSLPLPLLIAGGGGIALLIVAVLVAVMMSGSGTDEVAETKKPKSTGLLVLDWPEEERANASLMIDGKPKQVPASGPVEIKLRPGKHTVGIHRKDHEPVRKDLLVASSESVSFKPEFIPMEQVVVASTPTPTPSETSKPMDDGGFKWDPSQHQAAPAGFKGWTQDLAFARQKAASENKGILLVIGSSDGSPNTARLAKALADAGIVEGELGKRFVPVVVDLPLTSEGQDQIFDARTNIQFALQYLFRRKSLLEQIPVLALADKEGKPYAVQREWDKGFTDIQKIVDELHAKAEARNKLLDNLANSTAGPQRAVATAEMAQWVLDQKLVNQYRDDIQLWYQNAEQDDPDNAAGRLEIVLEAELFSRLQAGDIDNPVRLANVFSLLDPWLSKRKFVDPNRGAKLHTMAGMTLLAIEDTAQGTAHRERVAMYEPTDPEVLEQWRAFTAYDPRLLAFGTGFVIAEGGYMLTNNHVVEGEGKLAVRVPGVEQPVPATLIHTTESPDIALIKVEFPESFNPTPLPLADEKLRAAMKVAAFGYPRSDVLGDDVKVVEGIVAGLPNKRSENMLLLDMNINPGNSGGPLCDMRGNVIGMVTAKTNLEGGDNYGMAITIPDIEAFLTKHLPKEILRPKSNSADATKALDEAAEVITPAVLMVVKMK